MTCPQDFVCFILTNRRPDKVITYTSLRKSGYTGPIRLLVDSLDPTRAEYIKNFGDQVVVFDKLQSIAETESGDNFNDHRCIIYARNATFQVAQSLGFKYFIQLDDDYTSFNWRFDPKTGYLPSTPRILNLDKVFSIMLDFFSSTPLHSIAMLQGGDFIGGAQSSKAMKIQTSRKCMNSFLCSTEKPFRFFGRINEDVNTYTRGASTGLLFLSINQISVRQLQTQTNQGGMTQVYKNSGTYVKSFYSVMYHPSSVTIKLMGGTEKRLHHSVNWNATVPKILNESLRKV